MTDDFQSFLEERLRAAAAYVNGDVAGVSRLATRSSPATFFAPSGGMVEGAEKVIARFESDAHIFEPGSETDLEFLHSGASGDLGYWVGFQNGKVRMKGKPEPVPMRIRVTELFRKIEGRWQMIHRHADMLAVEKRP